jgi:hypothetical protein
MRVVYWDMKQCRMGYQKNISERLTASIFMAVQNDSQVHCLESSVLIYQHTYCHIPEEWNLQILSLCALISDKEMKPLIITTVISKYLLPDYVLHMSACTGHH